MPDSILDRSRMSLISASRSEPAAWIVWANSTCLSRQVAVGVLAQQLRQDQQAVQRRAQLVRHVGQELATCTCEVSASCSAFSSSAAWPARPRGSCARPRASGSASRLRLLLQLLVGLLQLVLLLRAAAPRTAAATRPAAPAACWSSCSSSCWLCSSAVSDCDCFSSSFGPHVGGDRVEHDADDLGELVEEGQVDLAEAVERGQLDHRLDLALEQHRQDDDVERRRLAEAELMRM